MQSKFVCSKCGESGFVTINDLERHIVKQHFSSVYALYKCCFTKCQVRFATEVDRLKHMDCKQHGRKYASLRALMPMQDEEFVSLRLAINDCLNESVNLSFSRLTESNGNNDQDPPSIESSAMRLIGLASTAHQRPAPTQQNFAGTYSAKKKRSNPKLSSRAATHTDQSTEAVVESIARRTDANASISKPRKTRLDNFGLNDESNIRTELDESLLVPAYPLSNDDSIQKNNETIGPVSASNLFVVKDEPSLFDELADTVPASSDHSDKLIPGNTDSIDKSNERTQPDTASTLSLVKDEPSVFDELASNRREKLALGNSENLSEQNNDRNGTEHVNSVVVKDEPNLMEELTTAFPSSSNYNDSLIPSDTESTALSLKSKRSSKQNFSDLYAENIKSTQAQTSSNPPVVKEEPSLIEELAADIPGLSYYDDDLTPTTSENLSEQNNVRNGTEHVNSVLVKDEPNLMEELTTAFPSSSNCNDSLVPSNTGSAAPSLKPKRSRKQNFSDLNIKSTQPQTSSSLPVVKEEPSLIDELAADIPGHSNYRISPSNNANSTDSDDEIRIFTEPPAPKRPRSRNRLGIYELKRRRYLTTEERHLIVSYSEAGHSSTEIAALLKCTPYHDSTNLESNTNSEVAENASIPVPKDLTEFSHSIANTALDTAQNPGENSITVDGFTKEVTEESLKEFYSQFGQVVGCTIGTDPETGRQSATVEFSSKEAVNRLNNRFFLNSRSNKERMPTSRTSPEGMFDGELVDVVGEPKSNRSQSIAVDKEPDQAQTRLKSFLESDEPKAVKSSSIAESKASNPTKSSNKLDFRRYHIWACGFSENVTEDMLREFYSRFGEVVSCSVRKQRNGEMSAVVAFSSKKAMNRALQSVQHRINNERVFVTVWTGPHELELRLLNLSPKTTEESLRKFYSKFGKLTRCVVNKAPRPSYVIFASHDDLDRALDAQPHVIDGSEVFLKYASGELDLIIKNVPEGITEESLHTHFSQYGQLRQCELLKTSDGNKHGYVSFSAIDEVNRAIEDRPHIIDKKILRTEFLNKSCSFSLFVDSLPKNATLESLFNAFSKFGKIVYLELHNDGGMNQRGPYGFVSYGTKQEADNALNTRPYKVDGSIVYVRIASQKHDEYNKKKLILNLNLSI